MTVAVGEQGLYGFRAGVGRGQRPVPAALRRADAAVVDGFDYKDVGWIRTRVVTSYTSWSADDIPALDSRFRGNDGYALFS